MDQDILDRGVSESEKSNETDDPNQICWNIEHIMCELKIKF
jgi:hypothetical protein